MTPVVHFLDVSLHNKTPGTEGFGYATDESTLDASGGTNVLDRFTWPGTRWAGFEAAPAPVLLNNGTSGTESACVAFQVGICAATPAGTYATTVFYTAVPSF